MKDVIHAALKPVKARQQWLFALRCAALGLLGGAVATGVAFAVNLGVNLPWQVGASLLAAGPVVGLIAGVALRKNWHGAAEAVDGHYGLKDRTVTALAFAEEGRTSDLHDLQMTEAVSHLGDVEPKAVTPLKAPREWPAVVAAVAVAVALLVFWPSKQQVAQAAAAPAPEHVEAMKADLKAKIADLEKKLNETVQDQEDDKSEEKKAIKELIDKLSNKLDEVAQPGTDEKEALAKLSEMDASMQAMATMLNVAALEGALSSLGTALAASAPFEGAGKALQDGKLEKAVKELDKLDEVKLTPKEAKALEEKLKQLAKQMGDAGQGSLSEAVGELADALKGGNGKVGQAAKNLSKKVNNAVKRKKINDLLTLANEDLKESKCQCQNNGGAKIKQPSKSNDPSSNWGRAVSLNEGEKTKSNGKRNDLQITGTPGGEGDSDVETTATPEARQKAAREYREKHEAAMKKNSEAVVEGEAIPLGHRQMVKKYFELIRPTNGDLADKPATPEKK